MKAAKKQQESKAAKGSSSRFVPKPMAENSDEIIEAAWQAGLPGLPMRGIPLFSQIDVLANFSVKFHRDALKPLGYTHTDYAILATLLLNGESMQPSLFTRMLDNASAATSQTLKKLESQGLLVREASETDKRSVLVALTEKGEQVARQLCEAEAEASNEVTRDLDDEELKQLRKALAKIIKLLK